MSSKLRLRQYADYKGYSIYKIEKICKLTHGSLKSGKEFTTDRIKHIRDNCPDLNMNWFIHDEGNMLLKGSILLQEEESEYKKPCKNCDFLENELKHNKELIISKNETIEVLKNSVMVKKSKAS